MTYNEIVVEKSFKKKISTEETEEIINGYSDEKRDSLMDYAKKRKVIPFIAKFLTDLNLDTTYWSEIVMQYSKRNNYFLQVIKRVFARFAVYGIEKVFVYENFGALLASDMDLCLFASGDVDLYADITERSLIEKALVEEGFVIRPFGKRDEQVHSGYYSNQLEYDFYISVMWQPISRLKLPFAVDSNYCIDWNNCYYYKSSKIRLPMQETLLYLCILHVSVHGYSRDPGIRIYIDAANLSLHETNWDIVLDFAKHDCQEVRVAAVCYLIDRMLRYRTPEVMWRLEGVKRKRLNMLLELIYDAQNDCLIRNPAGMRLLKIECYSDGNALLTGILHLVFPDAKWVRKYYCSDGGTLAAGYFKHINNICR